MRVTPLFTALILAFLSCKKDPPAVAPPPDHAPHSLQVDFKASEEGAPLVTASKVYYSPAGDSFTVTKFTYYISSLKLIREDGFEYAEPESYHLVRHVDGNTGFSIAGIPAGNYNRITFTIGIDSLHNVSGAQSGDLDPANNMFWDWNTGYIFYKLEGNYFDKTAPSAGMSPQFAIHIGGFSGDGNCIRSTTLTLPSELLVRPGTHSRITIQAAVEEVFKTPRTISIADYYNSLPAGNEINRHIADNYSNMFSVAGVQNDL
jgi:hypothetical protein